MNRVGIGRLIAGLSEKPPIILRPYQKRIREWYESIMDSREGGVYTLRQARQSGKNEIFAYNHYKVLMSGREGDYLVFAPTYPQTTIAKRRLDKYIGHFKAHIPSVEGRIYGSKSKLTFLTASRTGNILGHTASLGATLDEAQDIDQDVYETKILPMTASTNAPVFMVGTAGFKNDILYNSIIYNVSIKKDNYNISVPAEEVCACSDQYTKHYEEVCQKYGKDSILVKTQYDLIDVAAGGGLLTQQQVELMRGSHSREARPIPGAMYITMIDVGGSSDDPNPKNDCTVVITARLTPLQSMYMRPKVDIVSIEMMQGVNYSEQEQRILSYLSLWRPISCIIDARGIGEMLGEYLNNKCPIVYQYKAGANTVNQDIHNTLGYINRSLLSVYKEDDPNKVELLNQACNVGYTVTTNGNVKLDKVGNQKIDVFKALTYIPRCISESKVFKISDDTPESPL